MGSSKSQETTVGYHYRPAFLLGLTRSADAFLEFRAADKTAWDGSAQSYYLFGNQVVKYRRGERDSLYEQIPATGAITENARIMIRAPKLFGGEEDQGGIDGPLDIMFGGPEQEPNPYLVEEFGNQVAAWRGFTTIAWCGGRFGAMNPTMPKFSVKLRKIMRGWDGDWGGGACWYPQTAEIGMLMLPRLAVYVALDLSESMQETASNGLTRLANMKAAFIAALDVIAEGIAAGAAVDLMIVGFGDYPATRASITARAANASDIAALQEWIGARSAPWGTYFPAGTMDMAAFFAGAPADATRLAFFVTDGEPSDRFTTETPTEIAEAAGAHVAAIDGLTCYGVNIDLPNTAYTAMVANASTGVLRVDGGQPEQLTGILRNLMFGGLLAMNAAHSLLYVRVDSEKGGAPVDSVDLENLKAAADRLYSEGFGLCWEYNPERDTPDSWSAHICEIIGGSFERSVRDGKWRLHLVRDDYELDSLPIISDDTGVILSFREIPSVLDGAVNVVGVRYFDIERKEKVTVWARAPGLVRRFGEVRQIFDYPEIPVGSLAGRVAERKLREFITPKRSFEITTDPTFRHIDRFETVRYQDPKRAISDMVCIVGEKDGGTLTSGGIRWVLTQHIYGFADAELVEVEFGADDRPDDVPRPLTTAHIYEAPYVDLVGVIPRAELLALSDDVAFLQAVAASPGNGRNYAVAVHVQADDYRLGNSAAWCPTAVLNEEADRQRTTFTYSQGRQMQAVTAGAAVIWPGVGGAHDEWGVVESIDHETREIEIARGCADTVAWPHAAESRVWFLTLAGTVAGDGQEYTDGEEIVVKLLHNTGSRQMPPPETPGHALTFAGRFGRPYPPARVRINGQPEQSVVIGAVDIQWAHRDRVLQADQLYDQDAGSIGPEPGTTYTMRAFLNDVLDDEQTGITGTSATWSPSTGGLARVELFSVRDGLESWQAQVREFSIGAVLLDNRGDPITDNRNDPIVMR